MAAKKRILRMASYPTKEESGRGLNCYETSKIDDIKVIYLTWFKKLAQPFEVPPNVKLYTSSFYTNENPRTKNIITRLLFMIHRLFKLILFSIFGIYLIFKHRVDIVHIHSPMFGLVAVVGKFFGKQTFITFHGADFFRVENAIWYKLIARKLDCVFSISPRYIPRLKEIHSCQVLQIYNGIDLDIYKNFNQRRKPQIITVANFKKQKALDILIKGFDKFLKKYPELNNYNLVIVGKGLLFVEIQELISQLELMEKVKLVGQKERNSLIQLYNESEVFILPSIWEGFAKVLVEAMSCGCKVISTKVDSAPLVLEDWGYMINHSQPDEICESLKKIIEDENYPFNRQTKSLKRFTWNFVRDIYSNVVFAK